MDFIRFVNSRDIREYLYSLDYKLTGEKKLYLIDNCYRITLSEKIKWLNSLLNEPDSEVTIINPSYQYSGKRKGRNYDPEKGSVHDLARRVSTRYSRLLALFYDNHDAACYTVSILENNRTEFFTENIYFKSYEVAVSHCRKLIEEERGYGIRAVEIKKIYLSGEDAQNQAPEEIVAVYDGEMNMMNINGTKGNHEDSTEGLYIYLPVPFKKGDILVIPEERVYSGKGESIYDYNSEEPFIALSFYPDETLRGGADSSDINCDVLYFNKFRRMDLAEEVLIHNYDLEYCRKPLTGKFKLLKVLSSVMQDGELVDSTTLLTAVKYCKALTAFEEAKEDLVLYPALKYAFADTDEQKKILKESYYSSFPTSEALRFTDSIRIWLDDEREAPQGYHWCHSVNETICMIRECEMMAVAVEELNLDHDLGDYAADGGDAIKVLDFLAERETFYKIVIHTANPVGRQNMQRMIDRYWPK